MGWGRTFLLGDIGNRLDIEDTERSIRELRRESRTQEHVDRAQNQRLEALEDENDQLKLYVASLVQLLVGKGIVSTAEVRAFVDVIDPRTATEGSR